MQLVSKGDIERERATLHSCVLRDDITVLLRVSSRVGVYGFILEAKAHEKI